MERLRDSKGTPLSDGQLAGLRLLGSQLRRARLNRGWSQRNLEWVSGVDQTTISRLENGRLRSLRLARIAELMLALRGSWQIFGGGEPLNEPDDAKNGIAAEGDDFMAWVRGRIPDRA